LFEQPREGKMTSAEKPVESQLELSSTSAPKTPAAKVLEEENAIGLGRFTYYSDDRITAIFEDRTVLFSEPGFEKCTIVSGKDACSFVVNVDRPCQFAYYVRNTSLFREWATADKFSPTRPWRFENPSATRAQRIEQIAQATRRQLIFNQLSINQIDLLSAR
jgi:hypothetical protein